MAQPADVIESISRGDQAGRAIEQVRERLGEPQGLLPDIGGDPGVYVLIEEDIFSVAFDVGLGHTNEVDKGDLQEATSAYTTLQFDIGVDTRIADSINAGARLALSETIYHAERGFDSAALIGSLYVSEPVWGGVVLTADVTGGLNGGYDFDNGSAYVNGSLRAARPIVLDEGVVLIPVVFAGLVFAEQSEQDRWEAGASLRLAARLCDGLQLSLTGGVTYGNYDNFYEDVLFVGREDTTSYVGLSLAYQVSESVTATASVRYTNRTSTLDIVEYEETDASAAIGLSARF